MDDRLYADHPTARRRTSARRRLLQVRAGLIALALVAAACSGDDGTGPTSAGPDDPGEETAQEAEDPMGMVAVATEMTVNEVTGMFDTEIAFGGIPGGEDITLTGQGRYDFDAPAWEVMLDYAPVFQGALPDNVDTTVTARWVDGSYYLTSKVLSFFSGSDVDTVEASTMEELVENKELADSGLGVLNSAFAANPMGALLQAPAIENLAREGDGAVARYTGDLRLGDAYGTDAIGGVTQVVAKSGIHDTHVAQTGLNPDPVLEDFVVGATAEIDAEGHMSETGVTLDIGEAALEAGLPDAADLAGTMLTVRQQYADIGDLLDVIEAPEQTIPLADYKVTISF